MRLIRIYGFLLNKEFGSVHKSKKEAFKAQVFSGVWVWVVLAAYELSPHLEIVYWAPPVQVKTRVVFLIWRSLD